MVVCVATESERTFPVGRVDGDRGDFHEDLILANGGDRTLFCLDGRVRLDNDRSMGLWDFEVGHIEGWIGSGEGRGVPSVCAGLVRSLDLYISYTLPPDRYSCGKILRAADEAASDPTGARPTQNFHGACRDLEQRSRVCVRSMT